MAETGVGTEKSLCRMLGPWKEGLEDIGEGAEERRMAEKGVGTEESLWRMLGPRGRDGRERREMQKQEWALRSHCGGCARAVEGENGGHGRG
jgi:hypothetical protein